LDGLRDAARLCLEVEPQLRGLEAPDLEIIIKLHRVLLLALSLEAKTRPEKIALIKDLIKPVMQWAQLEEKRKQRELDLKKAGEGHAAETFSPECLEKIERELQLL
jgi:hypothetical protein